MRCVPVCCTKFAPSWTEFHEGHRDLTADGGQRFAATCMHVFTTLFPVAAEEDWLGRRGDGDRVSQRARARPCFERLRRRACDARRRSATGDRVHRLTAAGSCKRASSRGVTSRRLGGATCSLGGRVGARQRLLRPAGAAAHVSPRERARTARKQHPGTQLHPEVGSHSERRRSDPLQSIPAACTHSCLDRATPRLDRHSDRYPGRASPSPESAASLFSAVRPSPLSPRPGSTPARNIDRRRTPGMVARLH
jgi:hypothetical protein